MQSPLTDQQLVIAARAGSEAAWAELVERYYSPLLRYLTARVADRELASDLGQDTFVAVLTDLHRPTAECAFAAWLYRIAHHRVQRVWHSRRLHRVVSLEGLLELPRTSGPTPRQPVDPPDIFAEADLIARVLAELSPPLCEALLLNALQGFTAAEVAAILGVSLAAAERRISRAKEQFRARYNALMEESN